MIKVGIIGSNFGKIGLLPAFSAIKKCQVIGICKDHEWKEFIKNNQLDAVAIAVPPNRQYEIAKFALTKGLHVFAEKPLTANLYQAKELYKIALKNKTVTAVDFEFPEIPEWQKVKKLLDEKTFGKVKHVSVNWNWLSGDIKYRKKSWKTKAEEGGGVLSFYFSHGFYYLEHFIGEIKNIKTQFTHSKESAGGAETGIDLLLKFKNGATGTVQVSCASKGLVEHKLVFQCEKGVISLETQNSIVDNFVIKTYTEGGVKEIKVKKHKQTRNNDPRVKIIKILTQRFIDSCISQKQMSPSFKEGLRVQELIESARKNEF